ncbi:hypothetical protein cypCar_00003050 [Cyprinus carpio]|nr:hypothetical protein cypCar_00003050 [Cyprinus carpio]
MRDPNFFSRPISSEQHSQQCRKINKVTRWIVSSPFLQEIVDTERGYKIHVSEEALQRSSNRRGKTYKEVDLIVSILNEAFFRVSSSSDTKSENGICVYWHIDKNGKGVPTITVMICGVTKVYGKYTFYTDKEGSTVTPLCWINTQIVSYITVNGYLGLVMLFNMVMLGVVLVKIHKLRSQTLQIKDHRRRAWKEWVSILGLSCILGVPWILAFSTHGPLSLPSLYVFTILNSFQGKNLSQCYLKQKYVLMRYNHA